jgi:hypothetical protein
MKAAIMSANVINLALIVMAVILSWRRLISDLLEKVSARLRILIAAGVNAAS